jgi:hypothetical protein
VEVVLWSEGRLELPLEGLLRFFFQVTVATGGSDSNAGRRATVEMVLEKVCREDLRDELCSWTSPVDLWLRRLIYGPAYLRPGL